MAQKHIILRETCNDYNGQMVHVIVETSSMVIPRSKIRNSSLGLSVALEEDNKLSAQTFLAEAHHRLRGKLTVDTSVYTTVWPVDGTILQSVNLKIRNQSGEELIKAKSLSCKIIPE